MENKHLCKKCMNYTGKPKFLVLSFIGYELTFEGNFLNALIFSVTFNEFLKKTANS